MASKIERDYPWLALYVLCDGVCDAHIRSDRAGYRDVSNALAKHAMSVYRTNANFRRNLAIREANAARDWLFAYLENRVGDIFAKQVCKAEYVENAARLEADRKASLGIIDWEG